MWRDEKKEWAGDKKEGRQTAKAAGSVNALLVTHPGVAQSTGVPLLLSQVSAPCRPRQTGAAGTSAQVGRALPVPGCAGIRSPGSTRWRYPGASQRSIGRFHAGPWPCAGS